MSLSLSVYIYIYVFKYQIKCLFTIDFRLTLLYNMTYIQVTLIASHCDQYHRPNVNTWKAVPCNFSSGNDKFDHRLDPSTGTAPMIHENSTSSEPVISTSRSVWDDNDESRAQKGAGEVDIKGGLTGLARGSVSQWEKGTEEARHERHELETVTNPCDLLTPERDRVRVVVKYIYICIDLLIMLSYIIYILNHMMIYSI